MFHDGNMLRYQIIGLAAGGSAFKLKYGHRGRNKTVIDPEQKNVTSLLKITVIA